MPRVAPDADDQLVWLLNETTGNYNNEGTLGNNTAYQGVISNFINREAVGIFDNCAWFPGASDVPIGGAAAKNSIRGASTFNPQPPFTISLWVLIRAYASNTTYLVGKELRDPTINSTWGQYNWAIQLTLAGGGTNTGANITFEVATGPTSQTSFTITDFPIPLGNWNHVGFTHDGTNMRAYLNGCQLVYYSNGTQTPNTPESSPIYYTDGTDGYGSWTLGSPIATSAPKSDANYSVQDFRIANTVRPLSYFQNIYSQGQLSYGAAVKNQYYKLRAYDTGEGGHVPVYWVDTIVSLLNAPTPPNGGPYINLEICDTWIQ